MILHEGVTNPMETGRSDRHELSCGSWQDSVVSTPPTPSSQRVSKQMSKQSVRDTAPEMALRRELHRRGLRYRVNVRPDSQVRCTPDIVFGKARVVVFVDGCFWHGCPQHGTVPRANGDWWRAKLEANVERDKRLDHELMVRGWSVVRIWEHEPVNDAADRVERLVRHK